MRTGNSLGSNQATVQVKRGPCSEFTTVFLIWKNILVSALELIVLDDKSINHAFHYFKPICIKFMHSQKEEVPIIWQCTRRTANVWPAPLVSFALLALLRHPWILLDQIGLIHATAPWWLTRTTWLNSPWIKVESKHTLKINSNFVQIITRESKQNKKNVLKHFVNI